MRSALVIASLAWVVDEGLHGQSSWSAAFDQFGDRTWMLNGAIDQNGDLIAILVDENDPAHRRSSLLRIASTGALLAFAHVDESEHQTHLKEIRRTDGDDGFIAFGSQVNTLDPHPDGSSTIVYFKLDPELSVVYHGEVGVRAPAHHYVTICSPEEGVFTIAYTALFPNSFGENQLHLLTMDVSGNVLAENHVMSQLGWGSVGNISLWPSGGYVMTTHSFNYFSQSGAAFAMFLDDALIPIVSSAFEPTTDVNPAYLDNLRAPVYSIPKGDGDLYVSGFYIRAPDDQGALVRIADSTGTTIAEWEHNSPFFVDRPGIYRSMDRSADGELWFAQTENENGFWNFAFIVIAPSRVRVVRFDEDLTPTGEYVIDGFPDNLYYRHSAVIAAPDGGVYVLGAVTDLSDPEGQPKAWIQKIGPDDLVAVSEHETVSTARVHPNPGAEGFTAMLNGPVVQGGTLRLFDAQGRLVGTTPVQQSSARFNAQGLAPGMYFYHISDAQGRPRGSGKWVKE